MPFAHLTLTLAAATMAPTVAPAPPVQPTATKLISGFRSARFRMSPSDVRRAITTDFPNLPVAERFQPTEGTRVLQLTVPNLDPGPGPAVVSYVFGAMSHTLALVSVRWATRADATADDRKAVAVAALQLNSFLRASAQPKTVVDAKVLRPGEVSLYGALDANGAGVELVASGIPYVSKSDLPGLPSGPATLRLSYMVNPANPDVRPN
jgi:hypothetical protein